MDPQPPIVTNYDKWMYYNDRLTAPDSFISFGFYYLISAALQRRVWIPPSDKPIYPNQFMNFVSPPGVGKGLVTTEVMRFLSHHRMENPTDRATIVTGDSHGNVKTVDRAVMEAEANINFMQARGEQRTGRAANGTIEKPLLIPIAADASSYEALVLAISKAWRMKRFVRFDPKLQRNVNDIYSHSSICFCLEEITSLFRKKAEDVVTFLQQTWDCGDYVKDTKTQGTDRIQKSCVSILGGTNPEAMSKIFRDGLLNMGYASRCIFIYESRDRKTSMFFPELNDVQKQYYEDLLVHIKKLTDLHGQVTLSQETIDWLEEWWRECQNKRPNIHEKLQHYYARKKVHVAKMALAVHFGESTEMTIGIPEFQRAIHLLENGAEKRMHHALMTTSENPYYKLGTRILAYIKESGPKSRKELLAKFWPDLPTQSPKDALDNTIEHYVITGKIVPVRDKKLGIELFDIVREKDNDDI